LRVVLRPCAAAAYLKKVFKPGLATDDNGARGIRAMHRFAALALALALLAFAGCASPPRTDPGAVAAAYASEGRFDEASREIEIALRTHPKDLALQLQAAEIYERAGNIDKAVSHLEDSIEIAPDDAETWIRLAQLENGRGNTDDAYVAFRRAERLAPNDVRAVSGLALTADSLGFTEEAQRAYAHWSELDKSARPDGEPPPRD
jgi:tetratricopeptide (TPR) repeat protein